MTHRADIEKLIKDAYAARVSKNVDAALKCFAPDAIFELAGSPAAFPAATRVQGSANLRETFAALIAAFDILELKLLTSVIENGKAAMHWRVRVKYNPTGETHDTELFDLWTIENGLASSFVQFLDTALVAKLMASQ